jgi:hypothetical protein
MLEEGEAGDAYNAACVRYQFDLGDSLGRAADARILIDRCGPDVNLGRIYVSDSENAPDESESEILPPERDTFVHRLSPGCRTIYVGLQGYRVDVDAWSLSLDTEVPVVSGRWGRIKAHYR